MEHIEYNILGLHAEASSLKTKSSAKQPASNVFAANLSEEVAASSAGQTSLSAKSIAESYASKQADLLKQISSSRSMDERDALAQQYRDGMVDVMKNAGISATAASDSDKIVISGMTFDVLGSLSSLSKNVTAQFMQVSGSSGGSSSAGNSPSRSVHDVVFQTAAQNDELIQKINSAQSVDERLGYVDQMRETIEKALNDEGHSAFSYGSHDKLVINGILYDLFLASNGVGMNTRVQMLDHGPAENHGISIPDGHTSSGGTSSSNPVGMIFSIGSQMGSLLQQISSTFDLEERRELGSSFQQQMVEKMQAAGVDASAHEDPDKIVIGNSVYDVIRSLNRPGQQAELQALRFA